MLKFLIPAIVIAIGIAGALLFLPEPEIADRGVPTQPREEAKSSDDTRRAPDPLTAAEKPRSDQPTTTAQGETESAAKSGGGLEAPKVVPTFDVVRVTRDGNAVIAGRAEPGATVTVLDQGLPLGTVTADPNGEWVLIPQRQLDAGARELSIVAQGDGKAAVDSEQVVVLAVPDREDGGVPGRPLAVLTPRAGEGASRILQGPGAAKRGGRPAGGVSVDVVDYDDKGNVVISGRGVPDTEVRAYADGRLVGVSRTDTGGTWVLLPAESLRPGDYELRIDQVKTGGEVVARAATPFTRVEPARIVVREGQVIVQPGNSLWRIARATYGSGPRFTVIYDANKDQIRDPDVIFPGQVFAVPPTN